MRYHDLYQKCLESVPGKIRTAYESGRRPALGYTSNLDILMRWDAKTFSDLARVHLKGEPAFRSGETIGSISDFVRIVSYLIENGLGRELGIANGAVCAELERRFVCEHALGGTCAQGAAALARVGVPCVAQISDRSAQVCRQLDYPEIALVSPQGEAVPAMEMVSGQEPVKHFIMQYERGSRVQIGDRACVIPESNRIIMGYDDLHKTLPVDPHFLSYIEAHAPLIDSYNISGFNAIVSQDILRQTVGEMARHYRLVKQANPACILYLESAHYISGDSRHMVFNGLAPFLDILGMNEEELAELAQCRGHALAAGNGTSLLAALELALEMYPVKGLAVHSKDFAVYYGQELPGIDMAAALCLGNLLAGTKARVGRYGSPEECRGTLEIPLSPVGLALARSMPSRHKGRIVSIAPSRYMESPAATVGLGDTFVAGMQIAWLR